MRLVAACLLAIPYLTLLMRGISCAAKSPHQVPQLLRCQWRSPGSPINRRSGRLCFQNHRYTHIWHPDALVHERFLPLVADRRRVVVYLRGPYRACWPLGAFSGAAVTGRISRVLGTGEEAKPPVVSRQSSGSAPQPPLPISASSSPPPPPHIR